MPDVLFAADLLAGLKGKPKSLSSKYFYDAQGSKLFQQIMSLPEYYLTRAEYEILDTHKEALSKQLLQGDALEVIELGAGDGLKTRLLLEHLLSQSIRLRYVPIDISPQILDELVGSLNLPALEVIPQEGEYFTALAHHISQVAPLGQRLLLFLGSNIGNFTYPQAVDFLSHLRSLLRPNDWLLLGVDLQKHPALILAAYNDSQGITRAFNLNLLSRINTAVGANFDLTAFSHFPIYDPQAGEARSYLVSERLQQVHLGALGESVWFDWGETLHTETSRKYTPASIAALAQAAGLHVEATFLDCKGYFADVLLRVA